MYVHLQMAVIQRVAARLFARSDGRIHRADRLSDRQRLLGKKKKYELAGEEGFVVAHMAEVSKLCRGVGETMTVEAVSECCQPRGFEDKRCLQPADFRSFILDMLDWKNVCGSPPHTPLLNWS